MVKIIESKSTLFSTIEKHFPKAESVINGAKKLHHLTKKPQKA